MALSHPQFGLGAGAHQEVPFCAAARMATVVVPARGSVLGRMHENADSGACQMVYTGQSGHCYVRPVSCWFFPGKE
jgi:hypothetical protein